VSTPTARAKAASTSRPGGVERLRFRLPSMLALGLVTLVGLAAFFWPFFADPRIGEEHGHDAPWLFAALLALLAVVLLGELTATGLDAKAVAVLGVLAAVGGALRVLSAGTAGLEPMFFLVVLGGRVLGTSKGFMLGALALLTGAFLTGGVGPWLPFQMFACGWVALGAALLPRVGPRAERWLLAAYSVVAALGYGAVMNLWFWPFMTAGSAGGGAAFVPGAPLAENLQHYGVFYLATSLGYDAPRAVLTAVLVVLVGPSVLASLRRAVRRARFDAAPEFGPGVTPDASAPARTAV
jgi:energy-coupling factor transport system substrate-specific component